MFLRFSQDKTYYQKGQVFPFLIAILVIIIILAMITVNLGQIGIFRTDVSNAADAAALAGASVLSSALLGLGLKSDMMSGEMIVAVTVIILELLSGMIFVAIATYVAYLISEISTFLSALGEANMAWSNAYKTALQYAFQNAGIDEPRLSFEVFLNDPDIKNVYNISDPNALTPERIKELYDIYIKGDDSSKAPDIRRLIRERSQSGFSRFMEHPVTGFAKPIGEIKPGTTTKPPVISGYGWSQDSGGRFINSFDQKDSYANYENYVEVRVSGLNTYPLDLYSGFDTLYDNVIEPALNNIEANLPWWLKWVIKLVRWLIEWILQLLSIFLPAGLEMNNEKQNTNGAHITVEVKRHKRDKDLGLWRFRYGDVSAMAAAHAFMETDDKTIKPVFLDNADTVLSSFLALANPALGLAYFLDNWDSIFDTNRHLFETKLIFAQ